MKRLNVSLILGLIIFVIMLFAAFFPEAVTVNDPYATQQSYIDSSGYPAYPPFMPGNKWLLGTDELGRDIFSQIVYGTKTTLKTLLLAILALVAVTFPLGMMAGFGRKISKGFISILGSVFSTIPAIIFCIIILSMPYFRKLAVEYSIYAFALVIFIVETGRMGKLIELKVEEILNEPFIEGEIVIGKTPLQIAVQNVLPHLLPHLLIFISLEAARILFLMCQLGVFGVFMGNLGFDSETIADVGRSMSYEPEWAAMLGSSIKRFKTYPWIALSPLAAFFAGILCFNLIAEGLKIEFEKKDSRFISWVKGIPNIFSPKMLIYDIRQIKSNPIPGILKSGMIVAVLLLLFFPRNLSYSPFDRESAFLYAAELSKDNYKGRRAGTYESIKAADYIIEKIKDIGLKPVNMLPGVDSSVKEGYAFTFDLSSQTFIFKQELQIKVGNSEWRKLKSGMDFRVLNFPDASFTGSKPNFQFVEGEGLASRTLVNMVLDKAQPGICKAVFLAAPGKVGNEVADLVERIYAEGRIPIIQVSGEIGKILKEQDDVEISFDIKNRLVPLKQGRNIIGIIPGTNPVVKDELVVVGASYDGVGDEEEVKYPGALNNSSSVGVSLELARSLVQKGLPKKTILFAYWDYSDRAKSGTDNWSYPLAQGNKKGGFYIDLRYLGLKGSKKVILDTSRSSSERPDAQRYGKYVKNEIRNLGFWVENRVTDSRQSYSMHYKGFSCIALQPDGAEDFVNTPGDDISRVDKAMMEKTGQALLNALIRIAY